MKKDERKAYGISLMVSVVATAIGSGMMGVMLGSIVETYRLLTVQEGYMSSCISVGALAALVGGIFLRSRVTKPAFITWGGVLMAAMLVLIGLPSSFPVLLAECVLMGLGMGIMDSYQSAFLADLVPERSAQALGLLHGIFGIGGFALPLILRRLLKRFFWWRIYWMVGWLCLLLVLQFGLVSWRIGDRFSANHRLERSDGVRELFGFVGQAPFLVLLLSIFLGAAAQNGILVWTIRFVSGTLHDPELAPVCLSLFWITSTVSRIFTPRLPFRPSAVLAAGSAVTAVAWICGILSGSPRAMLICCGVSGLGSGCCIPVLLSEGAASSPENTGLTTSLLMMVKTAGQILMPLAVSAMRAGLGETMGMLLIGITFLADAGAVLGMLLVQRKRKI